MFAGRIFQTCRAVVIGGVVVAEFGFRVCLHPHGRSSREQRRTLRLLRAFIKIVREISERKKKESQARRESCKR